MTWPVVRMGELFRIKHGYAFKGQYFDSDGPYVLLTPGNFNETGGYRDQGDKTKFYTGDVPDGYVLEEGDLLVAMTEQASGLLGSSAWIPESNRFLHNQRLGRVVDLDENRLIKPFLYYLFNTREVRQQISARATGGKVRHTAPERIGQVVVRVPPRDAQRRIADALSAYDRLIENNRRRIGVLEEAARQLYHEWFLRLRFPGYEHTCINQGVPDGWERVPFEDALELQRGFDLPVQNREDGDVPVYGSTGIVGKHSRTRVTGPGIVTGRSGTLGSVHFVLEDFWPLNTALWVKKFKRVSPYYALFLMRNMDLKQYNGGASVPTLDRKAVHRVEILVPS
jgi:type I restriction enzyme S subunit